MNAAIILGFAVQIAASVQSDPRIPVRDALDSLAAAEQRFFFYWAEAWRVSEASRHEVALTMTSMPNATRGLFRQALIVCSTSPRVARTALEAEIGGRQIPNQDLNLGVCPSWFAGGIDAPDDERTAIDNALTDSLRKEVRLRRQVVIQRFATSDARLRGNNWFVGQFVRLLVDQRELAQARSAATECQASRWWCSVLEGYALAASGDLLKSERTFERGLREMPDAVRCEWSDERALLDDTKSAREYGALTCEERGKTNERIWWLSDPLFSVPGNERKVEQFVRRVSVELRRALDRDERFEWVASEGGAARRELVLRYGWPSYVWWGGYKYDMMVGCGCIYAGYTSRDRFIPNDVHATYEYDRMHRHFIPSWSAIRSPFSAQPDDWTIMSPRLIRDRGATFKGLGGARSERPARAINPVDSSLVDLMDWWPREHSASPVPLIQLPEGQLAFLRRQGSAVVASSLQLVEADLLRPQGERVSAVVTFMPGPDSVLRTERAEGQVGAALVSRSEIPAIPSVVSVEVPPDGRKPAARTRFGVAPPAPLSTMGQGERAISAPVFVQPFALSVDSLKANRALDRMLPTLSYDRGSKIALVWETYGFAPTDTVNVSVWIERYTPLGIGRRIGVALNLATDLNTPIAIQWQESQPGSLSYVIDGPVPIVGRGIDVDISGLIPGDYWMDVAVGYRGKEPVRSRRGFSVR